MSWPSERVIDLQEQGVLLVEDGNHGEYRPRPDEFVDDGVSFIRAADMDNGRVLFESAEKICAAAFERIRKGIGRPGDCLLSHKGTIGRTAFVPLDETTPFVCSPQTTFWRVIDEQKLDRGFLYFYMMSPHFVGQLRKVQNETDMAGYVSLTNQREFMVPLPPARTQQSIAEILSSLDEKIELNRKQSRTLEAIAQALFKRWFVEFEFPDENGRPYQSSGGAMQPSELGEIPVGWEVKPLDQIADYLNGLALQKFPPEGDEYLPVIKIREMKQGVTANSDKASTKLDPKYIVDDGDVLFSWSGSLEVDIWCQGKGALNQHLFKVTSEDYPKWFYYLWTKHHLRAFQAVAADKATTMGHIQRGHLSDALTVCPSEKILPVVSDTFEPLIDKIISCRIESRTLARLRDTLLPKLMSGELRVGEETRPQEQAR